MLDSVGISSSLEQIARGFTSAGDLRSRLE